MCVSELSPYNPFTTNTWVLVLINSLNSGYCQWERTIAKALNCYRHIGVNGNRDCSRRRLLAFEGE